ncbi:MAG: hypothetical protein GWN30_16245 [Gammaproteobacteria bacterium]|nr:hypothetical protein [Gammaproteobacteria bacterium]
MASWIVHLRIAEKILDHLPELDAGQFSIGNVAPDSGVPDKNWETFNPPPEVTHYNVKKSPGVPSVCHDLQFYREHMHGKVSLEKEPERFSFLLGYFFHLITDNLWTERILGPTKKRYRSEFDKNSGFIWEVKKDWYGLDFAYVRSHPDSLFWTVFVDSTYEVEYMDVFPKQAIPNQLEYIKTFYQRTDDEVEEKLRLSNNIYLNEAEMSLFVDGAYRDLFRVYQAIWQRGVQVEGYNSAIELMVN